MVIITITIMSQFLKLTSMIINKNLITSVFIKPNKYHIYTVDNYINVYMLFGTRGASASTVNFVICKERDSEDYKTISKWIDSIQEI